MKSTVSTAPVTLEDRTYPYLGVFCDGSFVVLFSEPKHGSVVYTTPEGGWKLGEHFNEWMEDTFSIYTGVVTLEN